jgi:Fe-Mn family superoxide dismutase
MYNFIKTIAEGRTPKELVQLELNYSRGSLDPSLSKDAMDYHFGSLYKAYVDRFNKGEGDADFNEAGAFLHNIYFSQFHAFTGTNNPTGAIVEFVETHFKTWDKFEEQFEKVAMGIQGSGWVYLSKKGTIKTITNHQIADDILILVDWWEHSFAIDYKADKKKYLKNQWKIIDWNIINAKLA